MNRLEKLENSVAELYLGKAETRDDWVDWLYENHVILAANYAAELANRFSINEELCRVAALLHDIADVKMKRFDTGHDAESLELARELMTSAEYSLPDIEIVVDDAVRFHSCSNGEEPSSDVGKILATADSMAHLRSDFYIFASRNLSSDKSFPEVKSWVLKKIERDINDKMFFPEIREELLSDYNSIKKLFSR